METKMFSQEPENIFKSFDTFRIRGNFQKLFRKQEQEALGKLIQFSRNHFQDQTSINKASRNQGALSGI